MEELEPTEIVKKVKKVEESAEWQAYFQRMDYDYSLWAVIKKIWDSHDGCINIRSNDIRTFSDKLIRLMVKAKVQYRVTPARLGRELATKESIEQANMLERMYQFVFNKANERLRRMGQTGLTESLAWFGVNRGSCNLRVLVYKSGDNMVFDLLPYDPRWQSYVRGKDGYAWINHKEFHMPETIYDMWGKDVGGGGSSDVSVPVFDYWCKVKDKVYNCVIDGNTSQNLREPLEHDMQEIPIVLNPVFSQPRIANEQGILMKYFADSAYSAARQAIDTQDELLSLEATKSHMLAKSPVVYQYEDETSRPDDKDLKPGYYPGSIIVIPKSVDIKEYPQRDISGSTQFVSNNYLRPQLQTALLPPIDFGFFGSPPPSGTLAQETKQAWDRALGAVTEAMSHCFTDACRLLDQQIRSNEFTIPVEQIEDNEFFIYDVPPPTLDAKYHIEVKFEPLEPFKQMINLQLGEMAARAGVPQEFIMDEYLGLQDIPEMKLKKTMEELEQQIPAIRYRDAIRAFVERGEYDKARDIDMFLKNQEYEGYAQNQQNFQNLKEQDLRMKEQDQKIKMLGQGPQGQQGEG